VSPPRPPPLYPRSCQTLSLRQRVVAVTTAGAIDAPSIVVLTDLIGADGFAEQSSWRRRAACRGSSGSVRQHGSHRVHSKRMWSVQSLPPAMTDPAATWARATHARIIRQTTARPRSSGTCAHLNCATNGGASRARNGGPTLPAHHSSHSWTLTTCGYHGNSKRRSRCSCQLVTKERRRPHGYPVRSLLSGLTPI
jgi:hypothetical protein